MNTKNVNNQSVHCYKVHFNLGMVSRCMLLSKTRSDTVNSAQHEAPLNNRIFTSASGYRSEDERLSQRKHRILSDLSYLIFNETHTHVIDSRPGIY